MSDAKRTETPHDRATRLLDVALEAMVAHPEMQVGDRVMVFLDAADNRSALVMHGYESDSEAIAHLFAHLQAILEANGKELRIIPIEEVGHG